MGLKGIAFPYKKKKRRKGGRVALDGPLAIPSGLPGQGESSRVG
jgi:hypothetical protein